MNLNKFYEPSVTATVSLYTQYRGPNGTLIIQLPRSGTRHPGREHISFSSFQGTFRLRRRGCASWDGTPTTQAHGRTREFDGNLSPTRPGLLPLRPCRNRQIRRIDSQTTRRRSQPQIRPRSQPQTRPSPRWSTPRSRHRHSPTLPARCRCCRCCRCCHRCCRCYRQTARGRSCCCRTRRTTPPTRAAAADPPSSADHRQSG